MKLLSVCSIVVILFVSTFGMGVTMAESPTIERQSFLVLRTNDVWDDAGKVRAMISTVANEFDYDEQTMLCVAMKESSMGMNKRCGDNGHSCHIFQIKQPTWDYLIKLMKEQSINTDYLEYSNYADQTYVTGWAIKNGLGNNWTPILDGRCK